jgi:hypothetical protein
MLDIVTKIREVWLVRELDGDLVHASDRIESGKIVESLQR